MAGRSRIRTDLALEATERFQAENVEVRGVEIRERYDEEKDVRTTVVRITTENGARTMGKPQGTYITIEAPDLSVPDEDYHREISEEVAHHLRELIDLGRQQSILVVGLGNQEITADSLGPRAVSNLHMTRHVIREYGLKSNEHMKMHQISGIVPGVMAQTGMETAEIIKGGLWQSDGCSSKDCRVLSGGKVYSEMGRDTISNAVSLGRIRVSTVNIEVAFQLGKLVEAASPFTVKVSSCSFES